MRAIGRSLALIVLVTVLVVIVNVSSDELDALECCADKVNFDSDEVIVRINGVDKEPMTTILAAQQLVAEEKTGYYNLKINGADYNHGPVIITPSLRDSGILITAEKVNYSISFDIENIVGTIPDSLDSITIGSQIVLPELTFSRVGYEMVGWNTGSNSSGESLSLGTTDVNTDFLESVFPDSDSVTLYPEWVPIQYSFHFNANSGSGIVPNPLSSLTVITGGIIPEVNLSRTGYSSAIWNTSPDGTGVDISPGAMSITEGVIDSCFATNHSVTLYPKWSLVKYTIQFSGEDMYRTIPDSLRDFTLGSSITLLNESFFRIGYNMSGWNTMEDLSGLSIPVGSRTVDEDFLQNIFVNGTEATLYPKCSKVKYTILFSVEDIYGTTPDPLRDFTVDSSISLPEATFSKIGYDMLGWNTRGDSTGLSLSIGARAVDSNFLQTLFTNGTEIILYPIWTTTKYTISLSLENGSITSDQWIKNDSSYTRDFTIESETITLPTVEPYDKFHNFICWEDQNENTVSSIPTGSHGDIQLNAVWALKEYTMSISINGSIVSKTCTLDTTLDDPECEDGFHFKGWFYKDEEGNEKEFTSMSQMYENMSIYAVFEPDEDSSDEMVISAALLVAVFSAVMIIAFRKR